MTKHSAFSEYGDTNLQNKVDILHVKDNLISQFPYSGIRHRISSSNLNNESSDFSKSVNVSRDPDSDENIPGNDINCDQIMDIDLPKLHIGKLNAAHYTPFVEAENQQFPIYFKRHSIPKNESNKFPTFLKTSTNITTETLESTNDYDTQDHNSEIYDDGSSHMRRNNIILPNFNKPQLVKVHHKELQKPQKIKPEIIKTNMKNCKENEKPNESSNRGTGKLISRLTKKIEENRKKLEKDNSEEDSPMSICDVINDLEKEIQLLNMRPGSHKSNNKKNNFTCRCIESISKQPSDLQQVPTWTKKNFDENISAQIHTVHNKQKTQNEKQKSIEGKHILLNNKNKNSAANNETISQIEMEDIPYIDDDCDSESNIVLSPIKCNKVHDTDTEFIKKKEDVTYFVTTHNYIKKKFFNLKKIRPNLESTLRSSQPNSSKQTNFSLQENSPISSIAKFTSPKIPLMNNPIQPVENSNKESVIPDEVEYFLENALGDQLYETSVTYLPRNACPTSNYNATDLISESMSPPRNNTPLRMPTTEPAPKRVSTFDRTRNLYRSLTQRIRKLKPDSKNKSEIVEQPIILEIKNGNNKIQELLQELEVQQTLIYQTSKAVNLCYNTRKFIGGPEHVESERLLLLTILKKKAISDEIKRLSSIQNNEEIHGTGSLDLSNFVLYMGENNTNDDIAEWFVIVVSYGSFVWVSQALTFDATNEKISFPDSVSIPNMTCNFKITIAVYSLRLKIVTYGNDSKRGHANWKSTCACTKRLWKKSERSVTPRQIIPSPIVGESSFVISGYTEFTKNDMPHTPPWTLENVPDESSLHPIIHFDHFLHLKILVTYSGFVTHADEVGGYAVWNRRWCLLQGHTLEFWNYPQEQGVKEPLFSIDLITCVSREAQIIDREKCAKPRTLMVKTVRSRTMEDVDSLLLECRNSLTIVRNLMSYDNINDMLKWKSYINLVINTLGEWNAISIFYETSEL